MAAHAAKAQFPRMRDEWGATRLHQAIFERSPEPTFVVEDDGRTILMNAAARALPNVDAAQFFRSPLTDEAALVSFRAKLRVEGRARHQVRAATPRGSRWVGLDGRSLGPYYVVVVRDWGSACVERVDLSASVSEAQRLIRLVAGPGVSVNLALDPRAGVVCVDGPRLEHILLNLTASARAAMPRGGRMFITTAPVPDTESEDGENGRYSLLTVTDTGGGLTSEEREHVFTGLLSRADPSQGSQLGLFVARRAVRLCGGCLSVRSAPHQGTSAMVYLPRAPKQPA
jgi:nitrogen-specific signal transduction histidine kinase